MDGRIAVKTEVLISQADEVSNLVSETRNAFSELKSLVNSTNGYWVGEGGDTHRNKYSQKESEIDIAIRRLNEHVTDLKAMAGVYDSAEKETTSVAQELISEVIS